MNMKNAKKDTTNQEKHENKKCKIENKNEENKKMIF